jgi:hypothetical protein
MCGTATYVLLVFFVFFRVFNLVLGHDGAANGNGHDGEWNDLNDVNMRDAGSRAKRSATKVRLIEEKDCAEEIKRLCGNLPSNSDDLLVLECIQSFKVSVTS